MSDIDFLFIMYTSKIKFWSSYMKKMLLREYIGYNALLEVFVPQEWRSLISKS
jgi:hypothetical protein